MTALVREHHQGLEDAAYWFETVQQADTQHKNRFAKALKEVS